MAIGPGIYDSECADALVRLKADAVMLVVINGTMGNGFSVTATNVKVLEGLAASLRSMAAQIEADTAALRRPPN